MLAVFAAAASSNACVVVTVALSGIVDDSGQEVAVARCSPRLTATWPACLRLRRMFDSWVPVGGHGQDARSGVPRLARGAGARAAAGGWPV